MLDPTRIFEAHVGRFFAGHTITTHQWTLGPTIESLPTFRVLRASPGPRTGLWTYVSVGASEPSSAESTVEFMLLAPREHLRHVELVTMAAWYHRQYGLGHGHTLPIGEPWLPGSDCDHFLVSTPYPFGPELETCELADGQIHLLWLLPISEAERQYKVEHGLDALERLFDQAKLEYWDVNRRSVV